MLIAGKLRDLTKDIVRRVGVLGVASCGFVGWLCDVRCVPTAR